MDRRSGAMKGAFILVLSIFGALSAQSAPPPIPVSPGSGLNSWHFNETNLVTVKGTYPRGFYGVELTPSWHSNAVRIAGPTGLLQYNEIDTNGVKNFVCDNGTVTFWFSPQWNTGVGPGAYGRLIEVGQYTTNASFGWWSLYTDPLGGWLYFGGQTNGAGSNYLSAPILWSSNDWHFVALTYSPTNSALYIDGHLATNGIGVAYYPGPEARWTNGFAIGSDTSGGNVAKGRFDWMQTYNYPLPGNMISNLYRQIVQNFPGLGGGGGDSLQSPGDSFMFDPMPLDGGEPSSSDQMQAKGPPVPAAR